MGRYLRYEIFKEDQIKTTHDHFNCEDCGMSFYAPQHQRALNKRRPVCPICMSDRERDELHEHNWKVLWGADDD